MAGNQGKHFTPEFSRAVGKLGGRPPGVLNKKTIEKMTTQEEFVKVIREKAGVIGDALLGNLLYNKDTTAGSILLDRAFGKVPQGVQMQVATFSLKELAEYRKGLQNPPEIDALPKDVPNINPPILNPPEGV